MQFDLFTFLASLFNFIVLLVFLRIFLFKRVVRAMDERKKRISDTWNEAEDAKSQAQEREQEYRRKIEDAEDERDSMLAHAREEVKQEKQRLMDEAREEVDEARRSWRESLKEQEQELSEELSRLLARTTHESLASSLRALADEDLSQRMRDRLLTRMTEDEDLQESLHNQELRFVSAESLSDSEREEITERLDRLGMEVTSFETDSSLIAGVKLVGTSRELSWSIQQHLSDLEQETRTILSEVGS